jgi:hypothetical protein
MRIIMKTQRRRQEGTMRIRINNKRKVKRKKRLRGERNLMGL